MKLCSQCKKVLYCSKICQTHHWAAHKQTCIYLPRPASNPYLTMSVHAPCSTQVNQHSPVTSLVGRQCHVECYLHGHRIQALLDTGSQVCVIDEVWKQIYLPEVPLRDVSNILEAPHTLNLVAAKGIDIPYTGICWSGIQIIITGISHSWTCHSDACSQGSKSLSPYHRFQCGRTNCELQWTSTTKHWKQKPTWKNSKSRISQPKEKQSPGVTLHACFLLSLICAR